MFPPQVNSTLDNRDFDTVIYETMWTQKIRLVKGYERNSHRISTKNFCLLVMGINQVRKSLELCHTTAQLSKSIAKHQNLIKTTHK